MEKRIEKALEVANRYGGIDGGHHKMWVIDQMVRVLTGCPEIELTGMNVSGDIYKYTALGKSDEYLEWIEGYRGGEDGPEAYLWDIGVAP